MGRRIRATGRQRTVFVTRNVQPWCCWCQCIQCVKRSNGFSAVARPAKADNQRLAAFQDTARDLIRTVEEAPRDLTAARKYLGVYLLGARDATAKFADIYARNRDQDAKEKYTSLLDDLEASFASHRVELLKDDRIDLDVEIEVLQDRLQREGISAR